MFVLFASLASAGHTHATAASAGASLTARSAPQSEPAANVDLDCALCAAAARLAHGTSLALAALPDLALARFHAHHAGDVAPESAPLGQREARAPPRLG